MTYSYGVENVVAEYASGNVLLSLDVVRYLDGNLDEVVEQIVQQGVLVEDNIVDEVMNAARIRLFAIAEADWNKMKEMPALEAQLDALAWTPGGQS